MRELPACNVADPDVCHDCNLEKPPAHQNIKWLWQLPYLGKAHVALFAHLLCKGSGDERGEGALEKRLLR